MNHYEDSLRDKYFPQILSNCEVVYVSRTVCEFTHSYCFFSSKHFQVLLKSSKHNAISCDSVRVSRDSLPCTAGSSGNRLWRDPETKKGSVCEIYTKGMTRGIPYRGRPNVNAIAVLL